MASKEREKNGKTENDSNNNLLPFLEMIPRRSFFFEFSKFFFLFLFLILFSYFISFLIIRLLAVSQKSGNNFQKTKNGKEKKKICFR